MQFEIYTEIDHADHSNWTDKHISADGKVYYMGKRDYQPYIKQLIYRLDDAQKNAWLESELVFLPYFRLIKPNIKVADFLNADDKTHFYPENLDGYRAHTEDDRTYFDTIIEPEVQYPSILVLVRQNDKVVYVESAFYRSDWQNIIKNIPPIANDKYAKGKISAFVANNLEIRPFVPIL
jgi:hypothetical protein